MTVYSKFYEENLNSEDFSHFTINNLLVEYHGTLDAGDTDAANFFLTLLENKGYKELSYNELRKEMYQQRTDIINACMGKI